MELQVLKATLSTRDARLGELRKGRIERVPLESVLARAMKGSPASTRYESIQGPTISPMPFWSIEVSTFKRNVGGRIRETPWVEGTLLGVETSRLGQRVRGTGAEKEKWRATSMKGTIESRYLFGLATSTWLLPFVVGHRALAVLPVAISPADDGRLHVFHDIGSSGSGTLEAYGSDLEGPSASIRKWARECQRIWSKVRKAGGYENATEYLDYAGKLSRLRPSGLRVIHTRSRLFYASLLDPDGSTPLGLPFDQAKLVTRIDGAPGEPTLHPIGGLIVDNKVHYVEVASIEEGHWLAALFNSKPFTDAVMARSKGEPPNIYSIPAQILAEKSIRFDPGLMIHQTLARLGGRLAAKMTKFVERHMVEEKGLDRAQLDDSCASPEVPPLVMGRKFREFLESQSEWIDSNEIASGIMAGDKARHRRIR